MTASHFKTHKNCTSRPADLPKKVIEEKHFRPAPPFQILHLQALAWDRQLAGSTPVVSMVTSP